MYIYRYIGFLINQINDNDLKSFLKQHTVAESKNNDFATNSIDFYWVKKFAPKNNSTKKFHKKIEKKSHNKINIQNVEDQFEQFKLMLFLST